MYYFAYGSNLNKRGMAHRCAAAKPIGTAVLKDFRLCFKRFADIEPAPGAQVLGALWEITPQGLRALDSYEGEDYGQITVEVKLDGKSVSVIAYAMQTHAPLAPPSMAYYNEVAVGYRDWQLDEALLRRARYDTLNVGPAAQSERPAPKSPPIKRRQALWDPAQQTSGSLDALTGLDLKRPAKK
jgi:gamma-glutamylcyclotransferase (GGCT)/AIG2-like uncharacterized protein YtfP